ncbi:MAG: glycosyltransferase family 4 protein [Clostridia bacterium]|nr:glycosyltransferase family 4 protein [Clostridia bacterium]
MKIAVIVPHFPPHIGGGEQLFLAVCQSLAERGHQVRVVTGNSGGITGRREMDGFEVTYCNWRTLFGQPVLRVRDIREVLGWCDVVHTSIYSTALRTILAARWAKRPCVVTFHEVMGDKWHLFEPNPLKALCFMCYERVLLHFARNVHAVSRSTERDYRKICRRPGRVFMIPNFLEFPEGAALEAAEPGFRELFGLETGERGILYFSRPAAIKGVFVLLDAVKRVEDRLRAGRARICMILSSAPEKGRQQVLDFIQREGLSDVVQIRNSLPRNQLLRVISEADLCVIPSVTEGFGFAAVEACHYGRPVICSDAGSLPEVAFGRVCFFRNRDAGDLAAKLRGYLENGVTGFEEIPEKHFDREPSIDAYVRMYEALLAHWA